ncbi:MAG: hydrogenase 2 operon protein HybA [Rhodospirillales bacterium]|nr:hydrogenase 2 operon protein HybA [Rhodospirillales bacterium]
MTLDRRDFLRALSIAGAGTALAASEVAPAGALQRPPKPVSPEAIGLLYDSTQCVGCKACVASCKRANDMPPDITADQRAWNEGTWDTAKGLSGNTLNVIKVYRDGSMEQKDRETDGFAFIKRQCLHCVDPSCVSCCPVSAMTKDPETGIVSHDPDRCIGCRYCVFACPFQVPVYQYDRAFGKIQKCQLCKHRLAEGEIPACAESCPTGATLFGRITDLRAEAHRRLELQPGDTYAYPSGELGGDRGDAYAPTEKTVRVSYLPEVYGEHVLGGTQALYLAAVPFEKLGLPHGNVPDYAYAAQTEGVQHLLYKGMIAPGAVLAGLVLLARRNFGKHHHEAEED